MSILGCFSPPVSPDLRSAFVGSDSVLFSVQILTFRKQILTLRNNTHKTQCSSDPRRLAAFWQDSQYQGRRNPTSLHLQRNQAHFYRLDPFQSVPSCEQHTWILCIQCLGLGRKHRCCRRWLEVQYNGTKVRTRHIILSCALKIIALWTTCFFGKGNDLVITWLSPIGTLTEVHLGFVGLRFEEWSGEVSLPAGPDASQCFLLVLLAVVWRYKVHKTGPRSQRQGLSSALYFNKQRWNLKWCASFSGWWIDYVGVKSTWWQCHSLCLGSVEFEMDTTANVVFNIAGGKQTGESLVSSAHALVFRWTQVLHAFLSNYDLNSIESTVQLPEASKVSVVCSRKQAGFRVVDKNKLPKMCMLALTNHSLKYSPRFCATLVYDTCVQNPCAPRVTSVILCQNSGLGAPFHIQYSSTIAVDINTQIM